MKEKVVLVILDGFGISEEKEGNAIYAAKTPCIDKLFKEKPYSLLIASGEEVGLPQGQMGNSEVGHSTIGSGRTIYQDLTRINKEIENGTFFKNIELINSIKKAEENNSNLHICGLYSYGGVHSNAEHLHALIKMVKKSNIKNVFLHLFLDGRDTLPTSASTDILNLIDIIKNEKNIKISTIIGRYYAMDRDSRFDRTEKAYNLIVKGDAKHVVKESDISIFLKKMYDKDITDEFMESILITNESGEKNHIEIEKNDSIILFNFRPDRIRQITRAITQDFSEFNVKDLKGIHFTTFTEIDKKLENIKIAFKKEEIINTLGEIISKNNLRQLRLAETEKYAHVTFFFNAGKEKPFNGEDRILIPSPKVSTYDKKPIMSAREIYEKLNEKINENIYDVIIVNFANPDMVGHTGKFKETVTAIEGIDNILGSIINDVDKNNYTLFITADHGNAEKMIEDGKVCTSHTNNPVPFIYVGKNDIKLKNGSLKDIAPTILDILHIEKPTEMTGSSLIY